MPKRPSLAERMREVVTPDAPPDNVPKLMTASGHATEQPQSREDVGRASGFHAATRTGKKKVTAPLAPLAHKQLKQLGLDLDINMETLLVEAINDLFNKYGKPPIA
jgi:Antitoxin-like ribbon-helix-helix